ncbi:MAG: KDO2-lipid IV(A) lauroyltransferase [Candidatus Omnitrophota bacterium]|jgi:KDO2-lipid IV(A) lauroyltransferase
MSKTSMDLKQALALIKPTFLGVLIYHCLPFRKKVLMQNLNIAFGKELSQKDIERIAKGFYSHVVRGFFENFSMSWISIDKLKARIEVRGIENLMRAAEKKKGVLLLTGHLGNWEMSPIAGILHFQQFRGRLHVLRRHLVNKRIEKILFNRYYAVGLDVIPKKNSLNNVMQSLENNDTVAFIMDQYSRPGKEGVEVPFFGRKAGTFKSLAVVARSSGAPILPTASWREPNGKHVMSIGEPIEWKEDDDPDKELYQNTLNFNHILEQFIRQHPDQWLWIHKRWKYKAPPIRKRKVKKPLPS